MKAGRADDSSSGVPGAPPAASVPRYSTVIFDIDGTLIDSSPALSRGFGLLYEERTGHAMPEGLRERATGLAGMEALAAVGLAPTRENLGRWLDLMFSHYDDVHVYDGVPGLLADLKASGVLLGIVTSEDRSELARGFARFGLLSFFDAVITAEDTERHKPYPDPLLAFLGRAEADAADCCYVGDAANDARCAHAAHVAFAAALWGARDADALASERPDFSASAPATLLSWLYAPRERNI